MIRVTTQIFVAMSLALGCTALAQADESRCGLETETVIIQPELTTYKIIPGEYKWVDGKRPGYSLEYRVEPAHYKTVEDDVTIIPSKESYLNKGRGGIKITPTITQTVARKALVKESYPVAKFVANKFKDGQTRIQTKQPKYEAVKIPAQTQTISRPKSCEIVSSVVTGI